MITYGGTLDRLRELGFAPCASERPDAPHSFRLSECVAAVKCVSPRNNWQEPSRNLVALVITAVDKKRILAVLEKHGLASGPRRTDSAGNLTFPLRYDEYSPMLSTKSETVAGEAEGAAIVETWDRADARLPHVSAIVRLDGNWTNGDLLSTPRADLPCIDDAGIAALLRDVNAVLPAAPWVAPVPYTDDNRPPNLREKNEPRWAKAKSLRDFQGNPNAYAVYKAALDAGLCEALPERPPDETISET